MKRKIAWVSILLLMIGMLGGCKRSPDEVSQLAGAATEVVRQEETETVQKEEEMIPPADQPEAEEPPKVGETVEEKEEQITPPETQEPQKPEVEEPSVEPEPQEPSEGKDEPEENEPEENEPEENEPEEEIDLNAGNRFSPRKRREPGYDKYYCDATIDDEFEPGVVIVRLKNEVSYPNKKWPLSTFACVDPVSAVHSNYFDDPEVIARINLETYTQRFEIALKEKTKEAVLKAIRELEKLDIVYWAQPEYTFKNTLPEMETPAMIAESTTVVNT